MEEDNSAHISDLNASFNDEQNINTSEKDEENGISYEYDEEERQSAFQKLAEAAKKYDKNHPSAVQLDAFEVAFMQPHELKDQLKRVFRVKVTDGELNALMDFYDPEREGHIVCSDFILKV